MEIFTAVGITATLAFLVFCIIRIMSFIGDYLDFRENVTRELNYQIKTNNDLWVSLGVCKADIMKLENRIVMLRSTDG